MDCRLIEQGLGDGSVISVVTRIISHMSLIGTEGDYDLFDGYLSGSQNVC